MAIPHDPQQKAGPGPSLGVSHLGPAGATPDALQQALDKMRENARREFLGVFDLYKDRPRPFNL